MGYKSNTRTLLHTLKLLKVDNEQTAVVMKSGGQRFSQKREKQIKR